VTMDTSLLRNMIVSRPHSGPRDFVRSEPFLRTVRSTLPRPSLLASVSGILPSLPTPLRAIGRKDPCRFRECRNSVGVTTFGRPTLFRTIDFVASVGSNRSRQTGRQLSKPR